ncbi:MAG: hypothetical protein JSW36_01960 [Burkholderiales bacterium]|nr:MAG: hypothetical protein JSW36_01960 [Burkholderiales bacterium]
MLFDATPAPAAHGTPASTDSQAGRVAHRRGQSTTTVTVNGKPVTVECTAAAARKLAERSRPLVVELELYFSCLVKKFVHFHDEAPPRATVRVADNLHLYFRVVTSTACTMELAERLGRQPETELDTVAARKLAPRRVRLDVVKGAWQAEFWM